MQDASIPLLCYSFGEDVIDSLKLIMMIRHDNGIY